MEKNLLRLKKIEKQLNIQRYLHESDKTVRYILAEIRQILEEDNLKEKYNYLNLVCNWALHIEIKESMTSVGILKNIADSILKNTEVVTWEKGTTAIVRSFVPGGKDTPTNSEPIVFERMNPASLVDDLDKFIFLELRKNLKEFLEAYGLPIDMVSVDEYWQCFLNGVVFVLIDSRLMLHRVSEKNKEVPLINKIKGSKEVGIKSLRLVVIPPNNEGRPRKYGYHNEIPWPYWEIEYDNDETVMVSCIYSSLESGCREPNLTGMSVGFWWKYGTLN